MLENLRWRDTKLFMNPYKMSSTFAQTILKITFLKEESERSKFIQVSCSCTSKQGVLPPHFSAALGCCIPETRTLAAEPHRLVQKAAQPDLRHAGEREAGGCIRSTAREHCSVHDPCFPFSWQMYWLSNPQTLVTCTSLSRLCANDTYNYTHH